MPRQKTNSTIKIDPFEDHPYSAVIPPPVDSEQALEEDPEYAEVKETVEPSPERTAPHAEPRRFSPSRTPSGRGEEARQAPLPQVSRTRQKLTVHLDEDLVNRVKNAAYWNPRLTIARIAERGLQLAIREVEKENGGRYRPRESELVGGRPIK
jgi:hypothetical protein